MDELKIGRNIYHYYNVQFSNGVPYKVFVSRFDERNKFRYV